VPVVTRAATDLAQRLAAAIIAEAAGPYLPTYVTRDQARAIINAARTTTHRLLLESLWQSGGRVTEVLRLRLSDLVEEVRQGVPVGKVQQQLAHARIETTSGYAKLVNPERRAIADRVHW
jgi:integrase